MRWRLLIGSWFWISPIRDLLFLRFYCVQEPFRCFTCQLDANSLQCMTVVTSYWLFLESSKYALGKKRSMKSNCINTRLINRGGNGFLSDVRMLVWQFGWLIKKRTTVGCYGKVRRCRKIFKIGTNSWKQFISVSLFISRLGFPVNKDFYRRPNFYKTF